MMLSGECHRCGLCCMFKNLRCENLEITGEPGNPEATRCMKYEERYHGMPILWLDPKGTIGMTGICTRGRMEELIIKKRGIGKGCSLREEQG